MLKYSQIQEKELARFCFGHCGLLLHTCAGPLGINTLAVRKYLLPNDIEFIKTAKVLTLITDPNLLCTSGESVHNRRNKKRMPIVSESLNLENCKHPKPNLSFCKNQLPVINGLNEGTKVLAQSRKCKKNISNNN